LSSSYSSSSSTALSLLTGSEAKATKKYLLLGGLGGLAVCILLLFVWPIFCVVNVGQIGIANKLGSIERYDPGLHYRNPVTKIEYLDTKTKLVEQSNYVPTKEGLTVELDTAVLLRVNPDDAISLYGSVGPEIHFKISRT
jgi:regulator of protease activity HflC (stomatin/prohibitin superfamily)